MIRTPSLAVRRVRQTLRFDNGRRVLWDLATSRTPWRRDELRFEIADGTVIRCPNVPGARVPVYELFVEDAYRLDELVRGLRDDFVAVDIGGQVGCFTTALAQRSPRARVHTFEASPTTASWLRRNIDGNGLTDRVEVHHAALADHHGTLAFADNGSGSGQNGLTAPEGTTTTVEVPCITFAESIARAGGRVDLVKIDTEGAEYGIIGASRPEHWASVQRVVLEYHPLPGHGWPELESFFRTAGLDPVRHERVDAGLGTVWLARA